MILVDSSVWIDHLHATEPTLTHHLSRDQVGSHPAVIEELALGTLRDRSAMLAGLERLHRFPVASHTELLELVERRRLWGRGLSAVDAHLLGSVALVPAARLWTRDKRLLAACRDLGLGWIDG